MFTIVTTCMLHQHSLLPIFIGQFGESGWRKHSVWHNCGLDLHTRCLCSQREILECVDLKLTSDANAVGDNCIMHVASIADCLKLLAESCIQHAFVCCQHLWGLPRMLVAQDWWQLDSINRNNLLARAFVSPSPTKVKQFDLILDCQHTLAWMRFSDVDSLMNAWFQLDAHCSVFLQNQKVKKWAMKKWAKSWVFANIFLSNFTGVRGWELLR